MSPLQSINEHKGALWQQCSLHPRFELLSTTTSVSCQASFCTYTVFQASCMRFAFYRKICSNEKVMNLREFPSQMKSQVSLSGIFDFKERTNAPSAREREERVLGGSLPLIASLLSVTSLDPNISQVLFPYGTKTRITSIMERFLPCLQPDPRALSAMRYQSQKFPPSMFRMLKVCCSSIT